MYAFLSHCMPCSVFSFTSHAVPLDMDTARWQLGPSSNVLSSLLAALSHPPKPPIQTRCCVNSIGLDSARRESSLSAAFVLINGLVTVPPVTSPFEVPRRRRYDIVPSNCHQQRSLSSAVNVTVPPPSPAKAEQLRGNKCMSRGTYGNSGTAEKTPTTAS